MENNTDDNIRYLLIFRYVHEATELDSTHRNIEIWSHLSGKNKLRIEHKLWEFKRILGIYCWL